MIINFENDTLQNVSFFLSFCISLLFVSLKKYICFGGLKMLSDFLPSGIYNALIIKNSEHEINEIHIRANKPITYVCNTKTYFLSETGACSSPSQAIYGSYELIQDIIFKASDYSIYSVNEQLKQGYIIVSGGIRIGVCGDVVIDGKVKTLKNFTSICIRVPHLIKNVALPIFNQILNDGNLNNTLIISPPGAGKTTMIRDIVYQFSFHNYPYNVFISDERGEITGGVDSNINLGYFCDSISFLNKKDSLVLGIRSMSPQIVICDELGGTDDYEALEYAINSGICVVATIHAKGVDDLKNKPEFKRFLENKYFKRYVVLSKANGAGTIEGVYNDNFSRIYGAGV